MSPKNRFPYQYNHHDGGLGPEQIEDNAQGCLVAATSSRTVPDLPACLLSCRCWEASEHQALQPRCGPTLSAAICSGLPMPLLDTKGEGLYPLLQSELDQMKAKRPTGGLMLRRDKSGRSSHQNGTARC